MTHIIAGRLQQQDQVEQATEQLVQAGFPRDQISSFFVNPAGQHDLYPVGGDRDKSPGAHESDTGWVTGATAGGAIGAAVGLAGTVVAGPLGPALGALVGAHTGSLVGTLSSMKEKGENEDGENEVPQRQSGMLVAVGTADEHQERTALEVLQGLGADQLEQAEGIIEQGDWKDFDPLMPPHLLKPMQQQPRQQG